MQCPYCSAPNQDIRAIETNHTKEQVRRRRKCLLCGQRFSTVEVVVKDGQRTTAKELVMLPEGLKAALTS